MFENHKRVTAKVRVRPRNGLRTCSHVTVAAMNEYEPSPAALLIAKVRRGAGTSVRAAARDIGLSEGRWRQIEKGYQQVTADVRAPVNTPPDTLARMAASLRIAPEQLRVVGAGEVADLVEHIRDRGPQYDIDWSDPQRVGDAIGEFHDRIELLERTVQKIQDQLRKEGEDRADDPAATSQTGVSPVGEPSSEGGSERQDVVTPLRPPIDYNAPPKAARRGGPAHPPDDTTGEESQLPPEDGD